MGSENRRSRIAQSLWTLIMLIALVAMSACSDNDMGPPEPTPSWSLSQDAN